MEAKRKMKRSSVHSGEETVFRAKKGNSDVHHWWKKQNFSMDEWEWKENEARSIIQEAEDG